MSKKKSKSSAASAKRTQTPVKKKSSAGMWIAGAVAALAVVAVIAIVLGGNGSSAASGSTTASSSPATSSGAVPAEEARYIGRLLPAGYAESSVAPATTYTSAVSATPVSIKQGKTATTLSVADVVAGKITSFTYTRTDGSTVPMVAYIKPSGKLYVGVSYCIPCKGSEQAIDADGTLRCVACGTKRDLETGVGISGACRLYPLDEIPVKVAGGTITIQNAALDGWTAQPLDRTVGA